MDKSLTDILMERPVEEIEAALDYFNAFPRHSRRKQDLVKALAVLFSEHPLDWLNALMEGDLRLLERLCDAGPDVPVDLIPSDYPMVTEVLHLADFDKSGDPDIVVASIPAALYSIVSKNIDAVIETKESNGDFDIERLTLGALHTYGVIPLSTFVDYVFARYDTIEEMQRFAASLTKCPVLRLYQEEYKGVTYMISPDVEDLEDLMRKRRKLYKSIRNYARLEADEYSRCGFNSPFCAFGEDRPEGKALRAMLYKVGYEDDELDYAMHSVWINSQYEPDDRNLDILLAPVTHRDADIETYEEFVECAQIIITYANTVPKWLLKGHSALQTGLMMYSLPDGYFQEEFEEYAGGEFSEELMKYFDNANRVRPVYPDDPCPCGSGLSYRLCHGKYVS